MDCAATPLPHSNRSADRVWGLEHPTVLQPLVGRIWLGESGETLTESLRHLPRSSSCYLGPSSPRDQCLQLKQNTETMHCSGIKTTEKPEAATEQQKATPIAGMPWHRTMACCSPAHLLPHPNRDLFFIIFGRSRHAASGQAPLTL